MADPSPVPADAPARKSQAAFRTISEVAEELDLPQHVLRVWETRFTQVRPLKRGGGRRYYRPEDVALLQRIRTLLHDEGYTIKGVQRLLRNGTGTQAPAARTQPAMVSVPRALLHDLRNELIDLRARLRDIGG